ncbi:MAG: TraR/DksA family transcriptional regulator [Deltaproteobacteria bacterium]|nr:TraR/DksA family transcriptional regulator [Deltaproteobacteria bacterium]
MANSKNKKHPVKKQKKAVKAKSKTVKPKKRAKVSAKPALKGFNSGSKRTAKKKPAKPPAKKPARAKKDAGSFKKETQKRLLNAKNEILADVSQKVKEESNPIKFEMGDIYDIASNERDRELSLILGDRDREKLASIEDALERLKEGIYGLCDECGELIGEERLKILPFTKVCVECKSKNEREHGARKKYEEETGLGIIEKTEAEEEF